MSIILLCFQLKYVILKWKQSPSESEIVEQWFSTCSSWHAWLKWSFHMVIYQMYFISGYLHYIVLYIVAKLLSWSINEIMLWLAVITIWETVLKSHIFRKVENHCCIISRHSYNIVWLNIFCLVYTENPILWHI